jgi:HK97 family phage major capsid protein
MATTQLAEQRANIWSQMTEIMDLAEREDRGLTVEEQTKYDAAEADLDRLGNELARAEKHEARKAEYAQVDRRGVVTPDVTPDEPQDTYESAFYGYLKGGMARLTNDQRLVLEKGAGEIQNALSVGTNTAGGYLVPPGYRDEFIVQMKNYGRVQDVATVIYTDSGQPLQWPTMNDTTNVGRLLAENTQMSETDVVIGTATLGAYVYSSDLTRVSLQLANDSAFSTKDFVQRAHAERIGRIVNQHFTTGTGTSQPQGIVTGATSGKTAAGVATFTADELIDLQHSVDPAYRNERSQFMLSDTALAIARKLKDSQNRYLFQPGGPAGTAAGVPDTIAGSPYVVNNDMAVPATGVKSVLYGDFQAGYVIRIVQDIQVIVFTERYLDFLQVGHSSFMRADGKTQNTSAYKALTQA